MNDRPRRHAGISRAALALLLLIPTPRAHAALGDSLRSIAVDRDAIKGTMRSRDAEGHTVHEIATPEGGLVRELISPSGVVFGVAWEGPRVPDLRQLLGAHFAAYAEAARAPHRRRGPLAVEIPGLVVESFGHSRAFRGRAYLPEMVPSGVPVDAIH